MPLHNSIKIPNIKPTINTTISLLYSLYTQITKTIHPLSKTFLELLLNMYLISHKTLLLL